jgi:hypothetical protein
MARKQKTNPDAPGAAGAAEAEAKIGDNSKRPELTPDELRALALQHKGHYERALKKKKDADAAFKLVCKTAKADGVTVTQIKTMIALDSPEGEARERAAIASTLLAAQWMGSPLGTQLALFDEPDRTPSVDRAFDEGKKDSMESKPAKPAYAPDLPQYKAYMDGYAEDQDRRAQQMGRGNAAAH